MDTHTHTHTHTHTTHTHYTHTHTITEFKKEKELVFGLNWQMTLVDLFSFNNSILHRKEGFTCFYKNHFIRTKSPKGEV